jgi:hypothetical protein
MYRISGARMKMVINLEFHKRRVKFWLSERVLASQEGLCSMEFISYLKAGYALFF